jgi:hypothetical protein
MESYNVTRGGDLVAAKTEQPIAIEDQRGGMLLGRGGESLFHLIHGAGCEDPDLLPDPLSGRRSSHFCAISTSEARRPESEICLAKAKHSAAMRLRSRGRSPNIAGSLPQAKMLKAFAGSKPKKKCGVLAALSVTASVAVAAAGGECCDRGFGESYAAV